ncbi:MarR family transcriptional regulator [Paenibacillus sp. TRM 82003]|nr:MarR family transcriptional regulator [Paenibacillus sp. TRM 82003]
MEAGIEQFVAYLQSINRHLRSTALDPNRLPVTRVQWLLLRKLHRKNGRTIGQLAEQLDVRASTMSQMLDRLEKAGLVTRETGESDARVKLIRLTAEGADVIAKAEKDWAEGLAEPFRALNEEEQETLLRLMKKLSDHLPRRGDD